MYRVVMTWSPRFKRVLPLVCGVAGRSGIRFHQGSRPEHSHGCILLSAGNLNRLLLLLQETREEAWMVVKGSKETHGTHRTHPCPPYEGREKGGGPTPALPTEGGGSRGRRLAGMVVGIVLTGIVLAGCRGVQPGVRIEKSMRSAIDSSQQRRYERIESRDTVVVAVGEMGITGGAGGPGGPGRPSSPRSQGGPGGMEVVYRSHYEIRTARDTVCRSHADTVYIERVDTVYPSRIERTVQSRVAQKKERRVPPFYRWCAGIVIGMMLLGAVWIGVRVRRRRSVGSVWR